MSWQSNGLYLAVKVDHYTKRKKSTYTHFQLFKIKKRGIPIEVLSFKNKSHTIADFSWEPKGHRFVVLWGDTLLPNIIIYSMQSANKTTCASKLATLEPRQAIEIYWPQNGRCMLLAALDSFNGQLEFYDNDEFGTMHIAEHLVINCIQWDPSGK